MYINLLPRIIIYYFPPEVSCFFFFFYSVIKFFPPKKHSFLSTTEPEAFDIYFEQKFNFGGNSTVLPTNPTSVKKSTFISYT